MTNLINITKSGEEYLAKLIKDKNEDNLSIRIFISDPGTPKAETCLAYCKEEEVVPEPAPVVKKKKVVKKKVAST